MAEQDTTLLTLNVNGLRNKLKRQTLFKFIDTIQADIMLLQETHSNTTNEDTWKTEWSSNNLYFNHGETNSKGVLIAIKKDFMININNIIKDKSGRVIILESTIDNSKTLIINTYMPVQSHEKSQLETLQFINNTINTIPYDNILLGGDLNVHLDSILDKGNLLEKR